MLNSKNIDTARLDSQLILGKVLNKDKIYLIVNSNEEVEEKD
ncbi:MAG: protein-(glutamine-N5) methyltransferase, release factor-specific, partial [Clostridium sp.]